MWQFERELDGQIFPIARSASVIGRSSTTARVDIPADAADQGFNCYISRQHVGVEVTDAGITISDLTNFGPKLDHPSCVWLHRGDGPLKSLESFKLLEKGFCGVPVRPALDRLAVGDRTNVFTLALRDADEADLAMMTMQPELAVTMDFEKATEAWIDNKTSTGGGCYTYQSVHVGFTCDDTHCDCHDGYGVNGSQESQAETLTGSCGNPIVGVRYHKRNHDFDLCEIAFSALQTAVKRKYVAIGAPGDEAVGWSGDEL